MTKIDKQGGETVPNLNCLGLPRSDQFDPNYKRQVPLTRISRLRFRMPPLGTPEERVARIEAAREAAREKRKAKRKAKRAAKAQKKKQTDGRAGDINTTTADTATAITVAPIAADTTQAKSWRDVLPIHPAANRIPNASDDERRGLAADLAKHGLKVPVVLVRVAGSSPQLIDGRHRLDLQEDTGIKVVGDGGVLVQHQIVDVADDAEAERLSLSLNAHRRHLTAERRRELIAEALRATPEKSDRQIAEAVKASPTTVGKVRAETEPTVQTGQLKRVGKDGKARKQPKKRDLEEERRAREERKRERRGGLPSYEEMMATQSATAAAPARISESTGNDVDTEQSAEQRKQAAADEETSPTDEQAPATGSMSKAEKKRRIKVASWMENAFDDLDLVISAVANEPDRVDADLLDQLQTKAAEFIEIARRARGKQAIGGVK